MRSLRVLALLACSALFLSQPARAASPANCSVGAYKLADGRLVDIAPSRKDTLRWRMFDGTSGALTKAADGRWTSTLGWTERPDGVSVTFSDCAKGELRFAGVQGRRITFDVAQSTFAGRDVSLAGRLILPPGRDPVPIVVLVHGSEDDSALDSNALQRLLPAAGVGAFVYDKRGTGASTGKYSQDFDLLADDAVAAMREARRLAGPRAGRIGYQGGSQGGWVVPIAASRAPVDFAIVSFGLAVSVIQEDQQQVALEMKLKGHGAEDTAKALEVADAAEAVFESGFKGGFERFAALRAKYRGEPWYKDLHGNFTWLILPHTEAEIRAMAKDYDWGTPWRYDPMPTLRKATTPQLWILGEMDLEAPSAETSRLIRSLIAAGQPITLALYPGAEHGMTEFETAPDGERLSTRFAPDYFKMMRDFARDGRLRGAYGRSTITPPTRR
ncbi:MAG: alpha/beta hydrolase [Alphaproteobacteria bacterium]|nr:alpha/beta hydrolase [Alphaproteobacteria bacterium]MBU1513131.1 alpha/beta hydrolase [Alphaproteobacteria bacterium]MBU2095239.1 alpha/beta hydrolase [Alphaproteobacteria bacterium]MBU2152155.1 alpha/beta hydrolase [Alphaproteobacteria bacterium]MBU2306799.1 alpha/beta hydrolase [Alphaproteobacteria bacterium]